MSPMQSALAAPRSSLLLGTLGGGIIGATWLFLVLARPTQWDSVFGSSPALITFVAYVCGAFLLLAASIPRLSSRTLALIPMALALNIITGQLLGAVGIPLYLDSIGTVMVAILAGPVAGLATGVLSSVVWALINPAALPFAAVSGLIGLLAGLAFARGIGNHSVKVTISGVGVGIISATLAAPVAAVVYGGTAGVGTGAVVALFREMGNSLLAAVTWQSFLSDPLDKALVFLIAWRCVKRLPASALTPSISPTLR
ncbi:MULTISPECIES: ECF transporter S component [unclassified Corynebacterium]|uniref:ECF transporter S component n=1 Tax=unclassified Corynebacterium TaxID=2624378 RepID=UPI0037C015E2